MKSLRTTKSQRTMSFVSCLAVIAILSDPAMLVLSTSDCAAAPASDSDSTVVDTESGYTTDYPYDELELVDQGVNPYLILMPGYQLVLEGPEDDGYMTLVITITDKTRKILVPEIGWVSTRVIEEKEWMDGIPKETARTFFAIDKKTNDVYDFGDETDIYNEEGTEVVSNEGGWLAGQPDDDGLAHAGIFMPGTFLLGAKYHQQLADGMSMERAENIAMGLTIDTPAGRLENCIKVRETNWSEPEGAETIKTHAKGIGLIGEDELQLVAYGYDIFDVDTGKIKIRSMPSIRPMQGDTAAATINALKASKSPKQQKITDEQASAIALKAVPGEVTGIALERKLGQLCIVVEVAADSGPETDVIIDPETGEVLGTET